MKSDNRLLLNDLLGSLNPKDWPIAIDDLPPGSALVGGSVRDGLLNKLSQKPDLDFVIPTNAIEFSQNLSRKIDATFIKLDEKRDITRLAINGWTLDFSSQAGGNLQDDLLRRDFRINAIALILGKNPEIFDPVGGINDLKSKKIVAISEQNLIEDPLRILRGFRLMCQLNFAIGTDTKRFLKTNANLLNQIAPERIKMEVLKIVNSEWKPSAWQTYIELQLLTNWNEDNILFSQLRRRNNFDQELLFAEPLAKLICLLSDYGLFKLGFSKSQIKRCKRLRFWVYKINNFGPENLSEDERFQLHIDLEQDLPSLILFLKDQHFNEWLRRWNDLSDPLFHPSSALSGHLLQLAFDIPPGPCLGELMRHLSKEKAYGRFLTNEEALEVARKWILENSPFL